MIITRHNFNLAIKRIGEFDEELSFDLETDGLDLWNENELCSIGIAIKTGPLMKDYETFYFPFRHKEKSMPLFAEQMELSPVNLPMNLMPEVLDALAKAKVLIGHNIKFDMAGIYKEGYRLPTGQRLEDTIVGARLWFPEKHDSLSLENSTKHILKIDDTDWKKILKAYMKKQKITDYSYVPPSILGPYCETDCKNTFMLRDKVVSHIYKTKQERVWIQESYLTRVLFEMETEGLFFDREYAMQVIPRIEEKLREIELAIYALAGREFNISSTDQLDVILKEKGFKPPVLTATGKSKWAVAELMSLDSEMANMVIEYRGIDKMRNTYFEPLLKWTDDRLHPNFRQSGTVTGRMSCVSPNLQNISNKIQNLVDTSVDPEQLVAIKAMMGALQGVDVKMGNAGGMTYGGLLSYGRKLDNDVNNISVKRLYIAPPGYNMWFIDFSQMEMRVFTDYVGDEIVLGELEQGTFDFHDYVAAQVWGISKSDNLWPFYRNISKAINFGLIYGIGNKKLATQIQKTEEEATEYRAKYFQRFPKAQQFMKAVARKIETEGYVTNRFGRRYHIDGDKAYTGVNYLVQGTSADIVKNRMIAIQEFIKKEKLRSRMIVQVHDELDFYVPEDETEVVKEFQKIMEVRQIKAYLATDVSIGTPSWGQKEKVCMKCMEVKTKDHDCEGVPKTLTTKRGYKIN